MFAAQAKALDEVVDVGQMVEDVAATQRHPSPPRDAAKQLQQPTVARAVDAGRPHDRHLDAVFDRSLPGQLFAFELGVLIDVTWPERRVFVGRRMLDVAVDTDGAAVHDAADAGLGGGRDELTRRPSR